MRLVFLVAFLVAAPAAAVDHARIANRSVDGYILPGFVGLAEATDHLAAAAEAACSGEGPIEIAPIEAAYGRVFDVWAAVGHFRFGPVEEDNDGFAIEFWPDTKGSTPRTLAALIAAEDPVVDDPAAFAQVSVAARGLMALDQLLFDPAAEPIEAGSYRCRLLEAITDDTAATSHRMLARWRDPWRGILRSAGAPDNPVYLTPEESTKALYAALADGLQADIDLRLGRPLGTFDKAQPRRAEAWRSGRSLRNILMSVEGKRLFFETVFAPEIGEEQARPVRDAFESVAGAAANVGAPIDVEVATPQGRIHVEALQTALRRVQTEVASHVGPVIGVTRGFNAMDGD